MSAAVPCDGCGFLVWLTAHGKLCKHLPEEDPYAPGHAVTAGGVDLSVPRCSMLPSCPAESWPSCSRGGPLDTIAGA